MSTNEQTPVSQPTSVVRNTLRKEQVSQELGESAFDAALREYCDRNYHKLLPIIAEKVHQEKVQQEKLKAVKARLNFEEPSQHSELGTPSRRISLKERIGSKHVCSMSRSPEPRRGHSESPRKRGPERKITFKRLEKVYSTGSETRGIVHPHTQTIQGVDHTTVVVETLKAATRVLTQKKQSLLLKNVITKEHPREGGKHYQKARIAHEDIESQSQRGKGRVLRMTCTSHGYAKKHILSLIGELPLAEKMHQRSGRNSQYQAERWGNPRKNLCEEERWRPLTTNEKNQFRHGNSKKLDISQTLRREASGINKGRSENRTYSPFSQNTKRNPGFGQKKVQASSSNDNPGRKKKRQQILRVPWGMEKIRQRRQKKETSGKEKPMAIPMVQLWQRVAKQKITQTFPPKSLISFSPLGEEDGTEGPMIIKAEMGGHFVYRMYVDGGSSLEIQYEHCFNRFRPEVKSQIIPATSSLVGISGEIIWPLGQISLFVKIGDGEHSTSAWMNFMVVRSPSPYNGIIERPGVRRIHAVPSTAHGILKFSVACGVVTLRSSRIIPLECTMVSEPRVPQPVINQVTEEKIQKQRSNKWKKSIAELPMLTAPKKKEELIMYLAAAKEAVSVVLMTDGDGKQMPIYFVSRAL
nr:reverse transcriptase domain-containing protein [Tanacetum cinerariifolium]